MKLLNLKEVVGQLVEFIQASFIEAGFSKAVIALSGGVDSATSCTLAVRALGPAKVYPQLFPYGKLNLQGIEDAKEVIKTLNIPNDHVDVVDIKPLVDPILQLDPLLDDIRKGNIMARTRMIVLFDQAKKQQALVVGTENKSEHLLGYFTRFGDEASDLEPLRDLYKIQVYDLAKYLGIPEQILTKQPTAGLWEGQTDEGEFGFSYQDADEILSLSFDEQKNIEEIVALGKDRQTVEKVLAWVKKNTFKHHLPLLPQQ